MLGQWIKKVGDTNAALAQRSEEIAAMARGHRIRSAAELDLVWFARFRITVTSALEHARARADIYDKLDANPELKEHFFKALSAYPAPSEEVAVPEPDWYISGPPSGPVATGGDQHTAALCQEGFESALKKYKELVESVRSQIYARPSLDREFRKALNEERLERLLEDHFPVLDRSSEV